LDTFGETDLHIWLIDLDGARAKAVSRDNYLSADEAARASRMRVGAVRERFVAARSVLRDLLGQYLDIHARAVRFQYLEKGKPRLDSAVASAQAPIEFNLSHSDRYALLALCRLGPVGIDIEKNSDRVSVDAITSHYLSIDERTQLNQVDGSQRRIRFFRAWVMKEAFMKCTGLGFSMPLDRFSVELIDDRHPGLVWLDDEYSEFGNCLLGEISVPDGFSGAWAMLPVGRQEARPDITYFRYDGPSAQKVPV